MLVISELEKVGEQYEKTLGPLNEESLLFGRGLDSLTLAILIMRLEDRLGIDPFFSRDYSEPKTLGEFVRLYENEFGRLNEKADP